MPDRYTGSVRRLRRLYRGVVRWIRRRLERTSTLVHVSILVFVPFLIGLLTYLSINLESLSFFLIPPLAAGTYALFARPESEYASPIRFVTGLTTGAVCAWIAIEVARRIVYPELPSALIEVDAPGAAFAVFLTGLVTWTLDVEEAAAFSMALLGLLIEPERQLSFVVSVFGTSSIVAIAFTVWRDQFYERRAQYLYESTKGDDHVLVPMCGELAETTAVLGGRLAAAHDAGEVVLLYVLERDRIPDSERSASESGSDRRDPDAASTVGVKSRDVDAVAVAGDAESASDETDPALAATIADLEQLAMRVRSELDVPCRVIVAESGPSLAESIQQVAIEADCDLIVVPYETANGELAPFIKELLNGRTDVLVHRSATGRTDWRRITVPIRRPGDTAHNMIDFALRLAGPTGQVSVAHCIDSEKRRREADEMLANLVETLEADVETRVANSPIERFLARVATTSDLVIIGASRDRSFASRLVKPPTFEQIHDLDTDLAIVARR